GAQGDVDRDQHRAGGEVQRSAQRVHQPEPVGAARAGATALLPHHLVPGAFAAEHVEDGVLRLDVGGGGEVAGALVESVQRGAERAADHGGARLGGGDGQVGIIN